MGQTSDNVYTSQSISAYNSSPPPDDGSVQASNKLQWAFHKTKLADPVKTLSEAINTAVLAAGTNLINTATGVRNQMSGSLAFEYATATIDGSVITPDSSSVAVGAESGATADSLQAIRTDSVYDGAMLYLRARHATEEITLVHATSTAATATDPNIYLTGQSDVTLNDSKSVVALQYEANSASGWVQVSRSDGGLYAWTTSATGDRTLDTSINAAVIDVDTSATDVTLTLPATVPANSRFGVRVSDNTNTVVLSGNGNNINGATEATLYRLYDFGQLYYDNAEWHMTLNPDLELLEEAVITSAVTEVDLTAGDWTKYRNMLVRIQGLKAGTGSTRTFIRLATGGAFVTTAVYDFASLGFDDLGANPSTNGQAGTGLAIVPSQEAGTTSFNTNGEIWLFDPNTSDDKHLGGWASFPNVTASARTAETQFSGRAAISGVIDGIRIYQESGNIDAGRFRLYGER